MCINAWNRWCELGTELFTLIEALLCDVVEIFILNVVRPSECDHLEKHVTCYEYEFINDIDYELSCFGIGFEGVWPSAKFILNVLQWFSVWICGDEQFL